MTKENMNIVKRIAIVAHESGKNDLIEWSFHNREVLKQHEVIAEWYTGDVLEGTLNIPICKLLTGSLGGYKELGEMIADGKVDVIIFIGYPGKTHATDSDMKTLLQLAEEHDLVIALNRSTAEAIISGVFLNGRELELLDADSALVERKVI